MIVFSISTAMNTNDASPKHSRISFIDSGTVLKILLRNGLYRVQICSPAVSVTVARSGLFDSRPILNMDSCSDRMASA